MSDADADAVLTAFADPLIALWNPSTSEGGGSPRERALAWIRNRSDWSNGDHCSWGIYLAADGTLLGTVSLHHLDFAQSTAQVGYWTVPAARGKGIAPQGVSAASRYAFGALGIRRLQLCHAIENTGSCRVAEKAGFALEGELRQSWFGDGRFHDEHLHARLASDPD